MDTIRYALVGDLVASRRVPERTEIAARTSAALDRLAATWPDDWVARPVTARGIDEISAVLARPDRAFDVAVALNAAVWPARFRIALGAGTIDVAPDSDDATAMDGPAFHRAADALRRAEADDATFAIDVPWVDPATVRVLECATRLHATIVESWKPSRARAADLYRELRNQQKVADELGISQQSVSDALQAARLDVLLELEDAVRDWFATRAVAEAEAER